MIGTHVTLGTDVFEGVLTIDCLIGPNVPAGSVEGSTLDIAGLINFDEIQFSEGGLNLFVEEDQARRLKLGDTGSPGRRTGAPPPRDVSIATLVAGYVPGQESSDRRLASPDFACFWAWATRYFVEQLGAGRRPERIRASEPLLERDVRGLPLFLDANIPHHLGHARRYADVPR